MEVSTFEIWVPHRCL